VTTWAKVGPDSVVAVVQKVGSQSIISALPFIDGGRLMSREEAALYSQRAAFIRDPIERLVSCFSHFYWLWKTGHQNDYIDDAIFRDDHQESYRAFVDYILLKQDSHWVPQSALLMHNGDYLPNIFHRFEDIHDRWQRYASGAIPWVNSFTHLTVEPYRADEIDDYYQEDRFLRGLCV